MSRQSKRSFQMVDTNKASSRNDGRKRSNRKDVQVEKNYLKQDTSVPETQDTVTQKECYFENVNHTDGDRLKNGVKNREAATPNHRGRKKNIIKQVKFDEKSIEETSPALKRHKLEEESPAVDSIGKKIESVVKKLKTHRSTRSCIEDSHSPLKLSETNTSEATKEQNVKNTSAVTRNRKSRAKKRISKSKGSKIDSRESRSKNSIIVANKNVMKTEKINFIVETKSESGNKKPRKNLPLLPDNHSLPDKALSKYSHAENLKLEKFSIKEAFENENSLNQLTEIHHEKSENGNILDELSHEAMRYSFETHSNADIFVSREHLEEKFEKTCETLDPFCQKVLNELNSHNKATHTTSQYIFDKSSENFSRNTVRNQNKLSELDENHCQFIINENKENIDVASNNINMANTLQSFKTDVGFNLEDIGSYITKTSDTLSKAAKLSDDELKQTLDENYVPYWPNAEGDRPKCTKTNANNTDLRAQQQEQDTVTIKVNTNNCGDTFDDIKPNGTVDEDRLLKNEASALLDAAAHNVNGLNYFEQSQIGDKNTNIFYPGVIEGGLVKQESECDTCYPKNLSTTPAEAEMPFSLIVSSCANIFPGDILADSIQSNPQNECFNEASVNCLSFHSTQTDAASASFAEKNRSLVEPQDGNEVFYICEECEFETKVENEFSFHYGFSHGPKKPPEGDEQSAICVQMDVGATQTNNVPSVQCSDQASTEPGSLVNPRTFQHTIKTRERKSKRLLVYDNSTGQGVVMYQCGVCQFRAEYGKQLEEHYAEAHGLLLELFECSHPHCRFVTFLQDSLLHHYRSQHVEVGVLLRTSE